jgi:hypothetical protein
MDGVKQQDSMPQNDSTQGIKWIKSSHKTLCSHIFTMITLILLKITLVCV